MQGDKIQKEEFQRNLNAWKWNADYIGPRKDKREFLTLTIPLFPNIQRYLETW